MSKIELPISKLSYSDILRVSQDEKSSIVFMPEVADTPSMYDVVIVLGGVSQENRIMKAAECYHEGKIERIIVSGGIGFLSTDRITTEAQKMNEQLRMLDVPSAVITLEDKSRNTYENIRNSLDILRRDGYVLDDTTKAILTSDFHLKRAIGMMSIQLDGGNIYGIGAKDGITDKEHWYDNPYGHFTIDKEFLLLLRYAKNNKIPDFLVDKPAKVRSRVRKY